MREGGEGRELSGDAVGDRLACEVSLDPIAQLREQEAEAAKLDAAIAADLWELGFGEDE